MARACSFAFASRVDSCSTSAAWNVYPQSALEFHSTRPAAYNARTRLSRYESKYRCFSWSPSSCAQNTPAMRAIQLKFSLLYSVRR